jgi:hypothetical protein
MILVCLNGEGRIAWVRQALAAQVWKRVPVVLMRDMVPAGAEADVLVFEKLDGGAGDFVRQLRAVAPLTPIVVCVPFDRALARGLGEVLADRVVWLDDAPGILTDAIAGLRAVPVRCRLASSISDAGIVRGRALEAIRVMLCSDGRTPRTTMRLARAIGTSEVSLRRDWRAQILPRTGLHIHDFIQWTLIVEAHEKYLRGASWVAVAHEAGVSVTTLRKAAADRVDLALDKLAKLSSDELHLRFAEKLARLLPASE